MFFLYQSNKTEVLFNKLATNLELDKPLDPFATEIFLVQSRGMERWLSQQFAEKFSIWANFSFLMPVNFFNFIASKLELSSSSEEYSREKLTWHIEESLRDLAGFPIISHYTSGKNADLKRFQLAATLADTFDQYQLMRPNFINNWSHNKANTKEKNELWQMKLWQKLARKTDGNKNRTTIIQDIITKLASNNKLSVSLPDRISVFGIHTMPPIFLDLLNNLAIHCDIHFYLLTPSKTSISPAPFVQSLAKQGSEFKQIITENILQKIIPTNSFHATNGTTLLSSLQNAIMDGENLSQTTSKQHKTLNDNSIIISSCHSKIREIAVLKNHILKRLNEDPDLHLNDIVVMAPDIHEYSALITAEFHDIQHSVADHSLISHNEYITAFDQFIDLLKGRCGWSEVLDLLENEHVYPNFDIHSTDIEQIRHWIHSTGIRWGLTDSHRQSLDLSQDLLNTWQSGIDRLFMGYATNDDQIEGSATKILGGLYEFINFLETCRINFNKPLSLNKWSEELVLATTKLFGKHDHINKSELIILLSKLIDLSTCNKDNFSLDIISYWLKSAVSEKKGSSGFLKGYLTFCSMLPMRSIPFKMICILGLNDGEFPRNDNPSTFDLIKKLPIKGDRSARADDRYQFLEAIMSARECLYLSYIGQSIQTNEIIPPSILISELLTFLKENNSIIAKHPLHPFSEQYFNKQAELFSYDQHSFEIAKAINKKWEKLTQKFKTITNKEDHRLIEFSDLLYFFKNPQKWFVENTLQVKLSQEKTEPEEHERFTFDNLEKYILASQIIDKIVKNEDKDDIYQQLLATNNWIAGTPGLLEFEKQYADLKEFSGKIINLTSEKESEFEIDINTTIPSTGKEYRLVGKLSNIYGNKCIIYNYSKIKGSSTLQAWIHHLLANMVTNKKITTHLIAKDDHLIFSAFDENIAPLSKLIEIFLAGNLSPSPLLPDPAYTYAKTKIDKPKSNPNTEAIKGLKKKLEYNNPEDKLLYKNTPASGRINKSFRSLCDEIMIPILEKTNK